MDDAVSANYPYSPDIPDFDAYPTARRVTAASAEGTAVRVTWDDGVECRYHAMWLRENAPDPETTHPVTREQALQLLEIPADLSAVEAAPDAAGGLQVSWSTGEASRYDRGWLRAYSPIDERPCHWLPPRRSWGDSSALEVPRFDGPSALSDERVLHQWAEALHVTGAAILENLGKGTEVIETVPARLGPIRDTNFGRFFDVISKPDADSNAYTAMGLPLHVDLATREYMPGLQFLHCIENAAKGGDSLLADGIEVAERLRGRDPEAFEALSTIPMTFGNKAKDTDYRYDCPMIRLDEEGRVDEVRWSPWLRLPMRAPYEAVEAVYRGLRAIFTLVEEPSLHTKVRLKSGDLLGFDNRRVLHGRTAYDPTTGERRLRGCYVERDELLSRLRILERHRRFEAQD